MQENLKFIVVA